MKQSTDTSCDYTLSDEYVMKAERKRMKCKDPEIGLALSGGGIRSASFSLGVLQALARHGILKEVDYLSTVSGGGYTGSALTWWLGRNIPEFPLDKLTEELRAGTTADNFPFGVVDPGDDSIGKQTSKAQHSILDFLRFHSSYLVPGGG